MLISTLLGFSSPAEDADREYAAASKLYEEGNYAAAIEHFQTAARIDAELGNSRKMDFQN